MTAQVNPKLLHIVPFDELVRTCLACPSQWEGTTEDGRMVYIRYRHGELTVSVSNLPTENIMDALGKDSTLVLREMISSEDDGYMDEGELYHILKKHGLINGE